MRYTKEVCVFIRNNVEGRTTAELAELVNSRFGTEFTVAKMKSFKTNHHLKSGTPCGTKKGEPTKLFPKDVRDFILAHNHGVGHEEMTRLVNDRFGTDYTMLQIRAYRKNRGLNSGLTGHFQKGVPSYNAGRKGFCAPGSEKGHFPEGHAPWNKTPVGTELVKTDGFLWRKVGPGARDWKQVHRLNWEAVHGPVPEGGRLIFLDGDRMNTDVNNLMLLTNAEMLQLTRSQLRSKDPEITEAAANLAKLTVQISATRRNLKE